MQKNVYKSHTGFRKLLLICSLCLFLSDVTKAASLVDVSDTLDNPNVSEGSDHTIIFTTPSGVSAGETITLQFSTVFDLSALTINDIDVSVSSTDLTLAGTAAGATWGVSISSTTIQLQSGTGTIAPGETVQIEIGTNATYGAAGSNQVQNPALPGAFSITIGGTFGDSSLVQVFVLQDNSISVSATVPGVAPSSTSDTGEQGTLSIRSQAVTFYDVEAFQVSEDQVYVQWRTNLPTDAYIVYGQESPYPLLGQSPQYGYAYQTEQTQRLSTTHGMLISQLETGTLYSLRPIAIASNQQYLGPELQIAPLFKTQIVTEIITEQGDVVCEVPEPKILQETRVVEVPSQCLCSSIVECEARFSSPTPQVDPTESDTRDGFVGSAIVGSNFNTIKKQPTIPKSSLANDDVPTPTQIPDLSITVMAEATQKIENLEQAVSGLAITSGSFFLIIIGLISHIIRIKKN